MALKSAICYARAVSFQLYPFGRFASIGEIGESETLSGESETLSRLNVRVGVVWSKMRVGVRINKGVGKTHV